MKAKGFFDNIYNSSFTQQGPAYGRGFAPPYGGMMLGANGHGQRLMMNKGLMTKGGRIRKRRSATGRGVMDHLKSAFNYLKKSKTAQKYGKEGIKYAASQAKKLISAKVEALKRKFKKEGRETDETAAATSKSLTGKPAIGKKGAVIDKQIGTTKAPETTFKLKRSLSLPGSRGYYGRGIRRRRISKPKRRNGRGLYSAKGLPPTPAGLRS